MDYNKPPYPQQQGEKANQPPPANQAPPPPANMAPPPYGQQGQVTATPVSWDVLIGYIAHGAAILTTLLATLLMGTAKQTKSLVEGIDATMSIKFSTFSAFK
jgi:hypothetical protein